MHDLDFDGSDIDTMLPDDDDGVVSFEFSAGIRVAFLSQVGRCFCLAPRGAPLPFFFGSEDGVSARSRVAVGQPMIQRRPLFRE